MTIESGTRAPSYHGPPPPALTAAQMAAVDALAMARGLALLQMMENAGGLLARAARLCPGWPATGCIEPAAAPILVLAGRGGNGGGAMAAARRLAGQGFAVTAISTVAKSQLIPATRRQWRWFTAMTGHPFRSILGDWKAGSRIRLPAATLIIDGLLGYSLKGAPRGAVAALIATANRHPAPILAVDLPSGVDPDLGTAPGEAIAAAMTLTLVLPKRGLAGPDGRRLAGRVWLGDIGIPPAWVAAAVPGLVAGQWYRGGDLQRLPAL